MANNPKHLAVLNAVAEKAGWDKPAPKGVYRGLAQHMRIRQLHRRLRRGLGSTAGKVKVHRIVGATNSGYAVNPAQIERQVAGSFIYGLTALFLGEITVKGGAIEQTNLDTYEMLRLAQMPKVETM